jgi:hypothetical protein
MAADRDHFFGQDVTCAFAPVAPAATNPGWPSSSARCSVRCRCRRACSVRRQRPLLCCAPSDRIVRAVRAAFGDSLTAGLVGGTRDQFVPYGAALAAQIGGVDVVSRGVVMESVHTMPGRLQTTLAEAEDRYDCVLLLGGSNDLWKGDAGAIWTSLCELYAQADACGASSLGLFTLPPFEPDVMKCTAAIAERSHMQAVRIPLPPSTLTIRAALACSNGRAALHRHPRAHRVHAPRRQPAYPRRERATRERLPCRLCRARRRTAGCVCAPRRAALCGLGLQRPRRCGRRRALPFLRGCRRADERNIGGAGSVRSESTIRSSRACVL